MNKLKEILIPVAVVAVGVLGAFATQMSGASSSAVQILEPGWIDNPLGCQSTSEMCSPIDTGTLCTVEVDGKSYVLRGKVNPAHSDCPKQLFKP